jgi:hypothetical protein
MSTSKFKARTRPEKTQDRVMGLGKTYSKEQFNTNGLGQCSSDLSSVIEEIRNRVHVSVLTMPNIEEVDWVLNGPQPDNFVNESFGSQIDPLHSGKSPAIAGTVESTLAMPGETQTYMVVCAVGWHLEPEPLCFTASGNAYNLPAGSSQQPFSPDYFTSNDYTNGGLGLGAPPSAGTVFAPANLEWGWWANYVAWLMVRGYNLRWQIGQNLNLVFDSLRNTAFMPSSSQEGSASSSLVDVTQFARRTNDYYSSVAPTAYTFLKEDAVRIGSVGTPAASNVGVFRPCRDNERVEATYGGMGLREMLRGNSEFRCLSTPYMLGAGIPIGLIAEEADSTLAHEMRNYLSITQGYGGSIVPPYVADSSGITANTYTLATGAGPMERTLDGYNIPQASPSSRLTFKGGRLKISVKLKGFEITENLYDCIRHNSAARQALCSDCGIQLASLGAR